MIPIPVGVEYTEYAQATIVKRVACERCRHEYGYYFTRCAAGSDTTVPLIDEAGGRRRAREVAQDVLDKVLRKECDPVPCPACGWYQADMVKVLRRAHVAWENKGIEYLGYFLAAQVFMTIALALFIDNLRLSAFPSFYWPAGAALSVAMVVLLLIRQQRLKAVHPNQDLSLNREIAKMRALDLDPEGGTNQRSGGIDAATAIQPSAEPRSRSDGVNPTDQNITL